MTAGAYGDQYANTVTAARGSDENPHRTTHTHYNQILPARYRAPPLSHVPEPKAIYTFEHKDLAAAPLASYQRRWLFHVLEHAPAASALTRKRVARTLALATGRMAGSFHSQQVRSILNWRTKMTILGKVKEETKTPTGMTIYDNFPQKRQ